MLGDCHQPQPAVIRCLCSPCAAVTGSTLHTAEGGVAALRFDYDQRLDGHSLQLGSPQHVSVRPVPQLAAPSNTACCSSDWQHLRGLASALLICRRGCSLTFDEEQSALCVARDACPSTAAEERAAKTQQRDAAGLGVKQRASVLSSFHTAFHTEATPVPCGTCICLLASTIASVPTLESHSEAAKETYARRRCMLCMMRRGLGPAR